MKIRLQKYLSECGVASRRQAEKLIASGCVKLNGQIVRELGVKCDPKNDRVECNGQPVEPPAETIYIVYHKPRGVTTTRADRHAEQTLTDVLPEKYRQLKPVGRLDKWSEGLLLLTNDGELIYRLTHPKFEMEKEYVVVVNQRVGRDQLKSLTDGVRIEGQVFRAKRIAQYQRLADGLQFHVTLTEGKKRMIRRMCSAIGLKVRHLRRIRIGPISLRSLPPGGHRPLNSRELAQLDKALSRKNPPER